MTAKVFRILFGPNTIALVDLILKPVVINLVYDTLELLITCIATLNSPCGIYTVAIVITDFEVTPIGWNNFLRTATTDLEVTPKEKVTFFKKDTEEEEVIAIFFSTSLLSIATVDLEVTAIV